MVELGAVVVVCRTGHVDGVSWTIWRSRVRGEGQGGAQDSSGSVRCAQHGSLKEHQDQYSLTF